MSVVMAVRMAAFRSAPFRHQVHSAFRAIAGFDLPHFGMHGTGVDRAALARFAVLMMVRVIVHRFTLSLERLDGNVANSADCNSWNTCANAPASEIALLECGIESVVTTRAAPAARISA